MPLDYKTTQRIPFTGTILNSQLSHSQEQRRKEDIEYYMQTAQTSLNYVGVLTFDHTCHSHDHHLQLNHSLASRKLKPVLPTVGCALLDTPR
jgi:hypothetical protein